MSARLATLALVLCAGAAPAEGLYKPCYGEMAVSLLMDVSQGATQAAATRFVDGWMAENESFLDAGFTTVTARILDVLNIDRSLQDDAYARALRTWRDCLARVYAAE